MATTQSGGNLLSLVSLFIFLFGAATSLSLTKMSQAAAAPGEVHATSVQQHLRPARDPQRAAVEVTSNSNNQTTPPASLLASSLCSASSQDDNNTCSNSDR
ncbi:hypothetical protein AABB24_020364 [Solanum stoloniferum]|uniref:Uncharacterized protein n=1 Tax=Solanum stoloniferum TaxID=62892 RepID=A0ABD2T8Z2_9SOLN